MIGSVKQMIAEAAAVAPVETVEQALKLVGNPGVQFIDVREQAELSAGTIPGAVHAPRGFLEFIADPESPMHKPALSPNKRLVLFCAAGGRSALAAKTLRDMGYPNVASLGGGLTAWKAAGGPVTQGN
jgi:rhodanese-related sulfurtransferase